MFPIYSPPPYPPCKPYTVESLTAYRDRLQSWNTGLSWPFKKRVIEPRNKFIEELNAEIEKLTIIKRREM